MIIYGRIDNSEKIGSKDKKKVCLILESDVEIENSIKGLEDIFSFYGEASLEKLFQTSNNDMFKYRLNCDDSFYFIYCEKIDSAKSYVLDDSSKNSFSGNIIRMRIYNEESCGYSKLLNCFSKLKKE